VGEPEGLRRANQPVDQRKMNRIMEVEITRHLTNKKKMHRISQNFKIARLLTPENGPLRKN